MRRRAFVATAAVLLSSAFAACSSEGSASGGASDGGGGSDAGGASGALAVVASTNVWGDIAASIGGDRIAVTSLISDPDMDPHEYEASARNQLAISEAVLVIENGGGYDDFVDRMLESAGNTDAVVLNAVESSGKTAAAGEELNEHVWYDVPTVSAVVDAIVSALGTADPDGADAFTAAGTTLKDSLQTLVDLEGTIRAAHEGEGVAITEPVPLYMLEACGLVDQTPAEFSEAVEEGADAPAAVLAETEALFADGKVRVLVWNEQTTGAQTDAVLDAAKAASVPAVGVTETLPDGSDYVSWMTGILTALQGALEG